MTHTTELAVTHSLTHFRALEMEAARKSDTLVRGCIEKFPDWVDNEMYAYNNKHLLISNTSGYCDKTHYSVSQNSDATAPSGRELYQFAVLAPGGQFGNFWIQTRVLLKHYTTSQPTRRRRHESSPPWKPQNSHSKCGTSIKRANFKTQSPRVYESGLRNFATRRRSVLWMDGNSISLEYSAVAN
jgi:hypothetical protein